MPSQAWILYVFPFIFGQLAQLFNQTFRFSPRFFIRFRFDFQNKCRRRLAQNYSYPHECLPTSKGSDLISWKLRDKIMIELKFFKNSQINVENLGRNHVHLTARHGIVFGRKILETKQIFSLSNSLPKDFRQRNRSLWLFPSDDCASKYVFVNSFLQGRQGPIHLARTLKF